jgi:hypothetical protein
VRMQLAVHTRLANAPGDQLRYLGAEVEDEDPVQDAVLGARSRALAGASRCGNSALPS